MSAPLRPLLPAIPGENRRSQPVPTERKRARVSAACEACRSHKSRCTGERPACRACVGRKTVCTYRQSESRKALQKYKNLQRRTSTYEELLSLMRTLPEQDAADLFRRVRAGGDTGAVVKHVEDGNLLIHALQSRSEADAQAILRRLREGHDVESILRHVTAGDLLLQLYVEPETRFRFVFPFQRQMPSFLRTADNQYLGSVLYETAFTVPESQGSSLAPINELYGPEYLKPYSSATIVDSKVEAVKPSDWTKVSVDDDLMRLLLKLYFQYEYPSWPLFQKDLFLEDMLSGSKRNCSSLLVNAILAYACHCHLAFSDRVEYWNPHSLGYRFFAEAKRLWEEESRNKNHITRVQAGILIFSLYGMYSMDKVGMTYAIHAIMVAEDLGIFGPPQQTWSERKKHSYGFTAWCVYSYWSLVCSHYMIPPLVKKSPGTPLPSCTEDPAWFGKFRLRYPDSRALTAMDYGQTFRSRAELCIIVSDLSPHLSDKENNTEGVPQKLIESVKKLVDWYSALPVELAPERIVFHFQLKLHALYHRILIDLCEAIMNAKALYESTPLLNDLPKMLRRSKICLETIMRLYYLRHGFENSDIYSTYFLEYLAFVGVERLKALRHSDSASSSEELKEAQSTLILAAKGLHDQGKNWYLPYTIFHMVCREMDPDDSGILHRYTGITKDELSTSRLRVRHVQCQYPIKLVNREGDLEHMQLEQLVQQYADMVLEASGSDVSEVESV